MKDCGQYVRRGSHHSVARSPWTFVGALFVSAVLFGQSVGAPLEECPFASVGEDVIAAYSLESWNSVWESCRAPELGDRLARLLRQEVIPSILKESANPEEAQDFNALGEELAERVNWESLCGSRISFVIWSGSDGLPMLTVQLLPEPGKLNEVHEAAGQLLSFPSDAFPETWTWRVGDRESVLGLSQAALESGTADFPWDATDEWVHLRKTDEAVWITLSHGAEDALAGPGLAANAAFTELWKRAPAPWDTAGVLDLTALDGMISKAFPVKAFAERTREETPRIQSSLVLDETMEALFSNDPETLEKLRAVESDMEVLAPDAGRNLEKISEVVDRALGLLSDQGILLSTGGDMDSGVVTNTLWCPKAGSDGALLTETSPLSNRFLSLLQPGVVEVSLFGLPDFSNLYETIMGFLEMAPDDGEAQRAWKGLQESIGIDFVEDVLPALGREVAWVNRQTPKSESGGIQAAGNELYVFLAVGEDSKAESLVGKLEGFLRGYDLALSATRIADCSFTVIDAGLFGKAMWGILSDPPVFVASKGTDPLFLEGLLENMRAEVPGRINEHRRWETLQTIWNPHPTAVSFSNLEVSWKQMKDQLRGTRMMVSMMGGSNPVLLSLMGFALELLDGIPTPDCLLRVDWQEDAVRISRSLLLFPSDISEGQPAGP